MRILPSHRHLFARYVRMFACLASVTVATTVAQASEAVTVPSFIEAFALGDRSAALKKLIPGTEDYYYYHCLYAQQQQDPESYQRYLQAWTHKKRHSHRRDAMQTRQTLLDYTTKPQQSLARLQQILNIRLNHQRTNSQKNDTIPTSLRQKYISWESYNKYVQTHWKSTFSGYETHALERLPMAVIASMTAKQIRVYVQRLQHPEVTGLVALLARELKDRHSSGFGSLNIHSKLTLVQLQELGKLVPKIRNDRQYVEHYLRRVRPRDGSGWQDDVQQRQQYSDRLWAFVSTLSAGHNALKAHVLYHRLVQDRQQGMFNRQRFLAYMALPRHTGYMNVRYMKRHNQYGVNLRENYKQITSYPSIGNDDALVRSYLEHFFISDENYSAFAPFCEESYLKRIFAEQRVLSNRGDMEQWSAWLGASAYRAIQERIELGFSPQNERYFPEGAAVSVQLQMKNINKMLVRVYPINTAAWYADHLQEVQTDFDVDGLVTELARSVVYQQPATQRHVETIALPSLNKRGIYIVEFLGNGNRCRAVIRIGNMNVRERVGTAGHVLTVYDDAHKKIMSASAQLGKQRFVADDQGNILIPFAASATTAGHKKIIIEDVRVVDGEQQRFAVLYDMTHSTEQYAFNIEAHIDSQAVLAGMQARVLVRPQLSLHGQAVGVRDLENISVTISTETIDGIESSVVIDDVQFNAIAAWTHDMRMPERVQRIAIAVRADIQQVSTGQRQTLSDRITIECNGLVRTAQIMDVYMRPTAEGYFLDILGRNGEAYGQTVIRDIEIKHRDFTQWRSFTLRSNAAGEVALGALHDITDIRIKGDVGKNRHWSLLHDTQRQSRILHLRSGEPYTLAWSHAASDMKQTHLFAMRNERIHSSVSDKIQLSPDGRLRIDALSAGNYRLVYPNGQHTVTLLVEDEQRTQPTEKNSHAYNRSAIRGAHRILSPTVPHGLTVHALTPDAGHYRFQVHGMSGATRVHVVATRFIADVSLIDGLGETVSRVHSEQYPYRTAAQFLPMQRLSDEHRYILERSDQRAFPTLMLKRPALLLHPWQREATNTFHAIGAGGGASGAFGRRSGGGKKRALGSSRDSHNAQTFSTSYDFLAHNAVVLSNLAIDEAGVVRIPKGLCADQQYLQVLVSEPEQAFQCNMILPALALQRRERRLMQAQNTVQQQSRSVQVLRTGDSHSVRNDSSSWRVLSSVAEAFELLDTLCDDKRLQDFSFLKHWNTLSASEQEKKYNDYACHELHVFLYMKDRAFFDAHVATTLGNKHDKTFIDHYLLDDDLSSYLRPWAFARLNACERALLVHRLGVHTAAATGVRRALGEALALTSNRAAADEHTFLTALHGKSLEQSVVLHGRMQPGTTLRYNGSEAGGSLSSMKEKSDKGYTFAAADATDMDGLMEETEAVPVAKSMQESKDESGYFADDRNDRQKRNRRIQLFSQIEGTKEWAEHNYYKRQPTESLAQYITVNPFWLAYANHDGDTFLHAQFSACHSNASEALIAMALMDLPFTAKEHSYAATATELTITAAQNALLYYVRFSALADDAQDKPLVAIQNLYRMNDRYRYEGNQRIEHFVNGACLSRDVYGAQMVLTNPSARMHEVDVLSQIPQGAIPLGLNKATRGKTVRLGAYSIETMSMQFYFPEAGSFSWYGTSMNSAQRVLAQAAARQLDVRTELDDSDQESWQYIADFGTDAQVIAYLKTHNIQRLDLERIAFRMQNPQTFRGVIDVLSDAHVYESVLWAYAFKHRQLSEMQQFLEPNQRLERDCGPYFTSTLFSTNAVERLHYEHLEYYPLVNARTHVLGGKRQIANAELAQQYIAFLQAVSYLPALRPSDQLEAVVYYIAQERIAEALALFAQIPRDHIHQRLQYDYCAAYLALCTEDIQTAEDLCQQYATAPIPRWKDMFAHMAAQIGDMRSDTMQIINEDDRNQQMAQQAAAAVMLDIEAQGNEVRLSYRNVERCTMNFYRMDLELLFSRNPFMRGDGGQFAYIAPNLSQQQTLPAGQTQIDIALPATMEHGNVLVEVVAAGLRRRVVLFVHQLHVLTQDNYGQLQVRDRAGVVRSKAYVKVYARKHDGSITFYKDGYTDFRGRFDYASLSTNDLDKVERFSILIVDPEHGALVRELAPPQR